MTLLEVMKSSFENELTKIAGFTRVGRRPISVSKLLKRSSMVKKSESSVAKHLSKLKSPSAKSMALLGAGALTYDQLQKARTDWKNGRAMRQQQGY